MARTNPPPKPPDNLINNPIFGKYFQQLYNALYQLWFSLSDPVGGTVAPVDAPYVTLAGNGTLTNERVLTAGSGISLADGGANGPVTVSTTITQYTNENAQDAAGAMVVGNTQTRITVTYDDSSNKMHFVVDGDLANYSNANTNFITAAGAPVQSVNGQTGAVVLTTAHISDSSNKRYVTDAQLAVLGNTSGTNTGDQSATTVAVTPAGNISSNNVQAALSELQGDIDTINSSLGGLTDAVVLKGTWDSSGGTFPGSGSAQAGWSYIVSTGGTVDGVTFDINDRLLAIVDNASAGTFSGNWHKLDYTDQVLSVNGMTGAVTITNISGNAATATALQTARNINGVAFDGTGNITVTADANTLTNTTLASNVVTSSLTSVGTITSGTWSGSFGAVSGANLTNITAANISAGTAGIDISGNSATVSTISGMISAGTNVSITGSGTSVSPYVINASGGGGTPGGSSGQMQYNNGGSFGGAAQVEYAASANHVMVTAASASDIPLVLRAASGQTGNILELQDSTGTAYIHFGPPVIAGNNGFKNIINVTATLPATTTTTTTGINILVTSAGSSSNAQQCMTALMLSGYTGSSPTIGYSINNQAGGSGASYAGSSSTASYRIASANHGGNFQVQNTASGTNVGAKIHVSGSSSANYAAWISATSTGNTPALNVGVASFALNATTNCAGLFALADYGTSAPTFTNAALIADNGGTTGDIAVFRDNGTATAKFADGGDLQFLNVGNGPSFKEGSGGYSGRVNLTSGVATVTITGITDSTHRVQVTRNTVGGTLGTGGFKAVITNNTLTITAIQTNNTTQTADTSQYTYLVYRYT